MEKKELEAEGIQQETVPDENGKHTNAKRDKLDLHDFRRHSVEVYLIIRRGRGERRN